MKQTRKIVLAYSGGLDTSYCIPYLREQKGFDVVTVTVDTGGFDAAELAEVEERAKTLGAVEHFTIDARQEVFERWVSYLVKGNVLRGQVYPLAVAAERVVSEGEEGVAAAVRQLGRERPDWRTGDPSMRYAADMDLETLARGPQPGPPPARLSGGMGTFEDDVLMSGRQRMTEAFDEGVTNLRAQIEYVKEQVKLNAASSQKFADEDETVQVMQTIVDKLSRGAGGAEAVTASGRGNRWLKLIDEFKAVDRVLRHEQSVGVPQLREVEARLSTYNAEVAELAERVGIRTQMEDIVNRVTGEAIPGLQKRVPRVSAEELGVVLCQS